MSTMWSANTEFINGQLHLAGKSASELAREFGTPAFFLDEDAFKARATSWRVALANEFGAHAGHVYYASKAFTCTTVARWISELGLGIDVCTGGELAVAIAGGVDPATIEMHGNNKSVAEIDRAVSLGVNIIVLDSLYEIERVAAAARKYGVRQSVLIRLTPGIQAHTHEKISTAHEDVKFGFSIASGAAWAAIEQIALLPELELRGVHCHIGSQIFGSDAFVGATERLLQFMARYRDAFGSELPELNLGGGYGIAYLPEEVTVEPADILPALGSLIRSLCAELALAIPSISIEPGRNIVGPAMFTLYEVGTEKDVLLEDGAIRKYISVDGGMSDNARTGLYQAEYSAILAARTSSAPLIQSRLVGKHCETGDIIIVDLDFPSDVKPGDLIATPATGAYGRSMASNYNHMPRPPVIAVSSTRARLIVRRESEADLLALDIDEM